MVGSYLSFRTNDSKKMNLYIKTHCPWCVEAREYLDQHGYTYTVKDVIADPEEYARMREISGQSLTPTLEVGDKVLADFDTGQLSVFLQQHFIKP